MKLLFDANLSPELVARLAALFPDSAHVFDSGLARFTSDEAIWEYARSNGFVIVTADSEFLGLAEECGTPPEVVRLNNCISELEHTPRQVLTIRNTWMALLVAITGPELRSTSSPPSPARDRSAIWRPRGQVTRNLGPRVRATLNSRSLGSVVSHPL